MTFADIFSLFCLVLMEVALGIDNVIFVSIIAGKLPAHQQARARRFWMIGGIAMRVALLILLTQMIKVMQSSLLDIDIPAINYTLGFTGKHLIMLVGGFFLLAKATLEIHEKLEGEHEEVKVSSASKTFGMVLLQILVIDTVFAVDSLVTAIGMTDNIYVMVIAVVLTMWGMFVFAKPLGDFVAQHPTFKMLALCFLVLIGVLLVAEGVGQHISKGYVYFSMVFALIVELINMRVRKRATPVQLNMLKLEGEGNAEKAMD